MQGIADIGIADIGIANATIAAPALGMVVLAVVLMAIAAFKLRSAVRSRENANPLGGFFASSSFDSQLQTAAKRSANMPPRPISSPAPALHGQRAQYARLCEVWERDTREEAIEQIARVMRASMDAAPAPLKVVKADPVFDAIEWQAQCEAEWEEIKLLPPPASSPASQAA